jgi:hypothetical protein
MLRRRGAGEADDAALAARDAARLLQRGEALHWSRLGADSRWLLLLGAASVVERAPAARTPA